MANFASIELKRWRQFGRVDIDLSRQTTIITGQNGSGKTTLLNALSMHFGWSLSYVSAPARSKRRLQNLWSDVHAEQIFDPQDESNERVEVGAIRYDNGRSCVLATQKFVGANYQLEYGGLESVTGMYIPSHRPAAIYTPIANIPTNPVAASDQYQQYQQFMLQLFGGGNVRNPGSIQKQSLISFAVFGEGNSSVNANREYLEIFRSFQEKLRIMMPKEIGFRRIEVRSGDLVIVSRSGDFALDAMSGGINTIFSIAWQLTMFSASNDRFTVIIDEPENHLHPSMQRSLLPSLAKAFPQTRFIASTHSPSIITSFPEASVYGLSYRRGRVYSELLSVDDLSGTPNQILREILGVDSNLPTWVEERVARVMAVSEGLPPEERGARVMQLLDQLKLGDAIAEYKVRARP